MSSQSKEGVLAVCGSLLGLSAIAVGLRFYARRKTRMPIMTDDLLTIASFVTFAGAAIVSIISKFPISTSMLFDFLYRNMLTHLIVVHYHIIGYALSPAIAGELSAKLQIAWDVLGTTSLACSKLSALFFYRRIFYIGERRNWFNTVIIGTIFVVILWLFVFQFLTGFQCGTHFSALWDGNYERYCTLSFPFLYGLAISDFLLDIWILSLPVPRVLRLNAPLFKKIAVLGVFFLTFIGVFASGARMYQYIQTERGGPDYFIKHDEERAITIIFFYTMLEIGVSLIAVNLPSLWFLVSSINSDKILRQISSKLSFSSLSSDSDKTPMGTLP